MAHLGALRAFGDDLPVASRSSSRARRRSAPTRCRRCSRSTATSSRADVIVIADSGNWDIGEPALTTTLRGLVRMYVEVRTLDHAVHSGMWGGVVPDALMTLCRLLATLHDDGATSRSRGCVGGPAADVDYPEDRVRAESGIADGVELDRRRLDRRAAVDQAAPQRARHRRTRSPRAPATPWSRRPRQDHAAGRARRRTANAHAAAARAPRAARAVGRPGHAARSADKGEPFAIDANGPAYDAARAAFADAWDGTEPVDMGVGGSIPFIAEFPETFPDAGVLVTGVEDPDTRAHGANEGLHLAEFERVCVAEALLLRNLGGMGGMGG